MTKRQPEAEHRRRVWLFAGAGGAAVAVATAAALALAFGSGHGTPPRITVGPAAKGPPTLPPRGTLVLAGQAGRLAVGVAVRPRPSAVALTATVIGGDGDGVDGLRVRFAVATRAGVRAVNGAPCGSGCYRAATALPATPKRVVVRLRSARLVFALPQRWPAPSGGSLVRRASAAFRRLRTVVIHERLASGTGEPLVTTWRLAAPTSFAYRIRRGAEAVVIGRKRWDRVPGGRWERSSQEPPLPQPREPWQRVSNAYLLGEATSAGRRVSIVSFLDRSIPAWFELTVDHATMRPLQAHMVATAHFMLDRYGSFNRQVGIRPPTGR